MKIMLASPLPLVEVSSSLGTVLERKDAPYLWPQVNQVQWKKKYSSLTATPFLPVMPLNIYCINKLPSPCSPIHSGQPGRQITFSPPPAGAFSPPCTLLSCLRVAVRGGAVRQGRPGVGREPAFGCQGVRIPEDLCLARWDGLCLLRTGAVPQHRRAAGIVAASVRSAARCSRVSQRLQKPAPGTPASRVFQTFPSLGTAAGQAQPAGPSKVGERGAVPGAEAFADYVPVLP